MLLPNSKDIFYEFILLHIERDGYVDAFISGVKEQCDKFVAEGFLKYDGRQSSSLGTKGHRYSLVD